MSRIWPDTSRGACPTVMLRHEMPAQAEVASHVDWLLAREAKASSPLMCFRLERPLHELPVSAAMIAERIQDHRTAYLIYEGSISGDRGTVARISDGLILAVRGEEAGRVELDIQWRITGDLTETMTLGLISEPIAGKYQVKLLATDRSSRYK